jgi:NADPH:quinone reductase-like Zn-dependent oxidoreductase
MGGPFTYFTNPAQVLRYVRGWLFGPRYANVLLYAQSKLLGEIVQLAEQGQVEVVVQDVIRGILDEKSEAWKRVFALMEEGRVRGKIVVDIG